MNAVGAVGAPPRTAPPPAAPARPGGVTPADRLDVRFHRLAARHPDRPALTDADGTVTYGWLAEQARAVTAALRGRVTPGAPVALRAVASRHALAGLLGILGAGACYVPVDPAYPSERRRHLLEDSRAAHVLARDEPDPDTGERIVDRIGELVLTARPDAAAPHEMPGDAAYVIYTSGSTGTPKGCVVGHAHVLALLDAALPLYGAGPDDVWTLFHSWSFDFSVWEIWGALLTGARTVVVDRSVAADPETFAGLLAEERVTVLNQVPSAFGALVTEAAATGLRLPALRHVVLGGEALVPDDVRRWWRADIAPHCAVTNMYGITETTVHVTHGPLTPAVLDEAAAGRTPIGRPLAHLTVELRDEQGRPVAPGEPGELWVGGAGVSHGYLARPGLTASRFPTAPDGRRHYRSGDWAVADEDGRLYYVGRMDGQVKLRGFRIELGEIEAQLRAVEGVSQAACLVEAAGPDGGAEQLTACLVADRTVTPPRAVREALAVRLPSHMLPRRLVYLDRLPLTAHGKLDRRALAARSSADAGPAGG
ncbi:amino acid adenylation domain-containing protein [Streptomyces sp. NPDC017936]|uniref:amino acid adenylation domain-containing protein n=1 Tax=Streptomyces sp. NPDC017936 TaxID=3365016 RepID=UPI0037A7898F